MCIPLFFTDQKWWAMFIYQALSFSDPEPCPYLPEKTMSLAYFFASDINETELDQLIATGWRKFGFYFFKPACPRCSCCIPVRIHADSFIHSKSQRRVVRKNRNVEVRFEEREKFDDIFEIYADHAMARFGREAHREEFEHNLCTKSCPSLQSCFYVNGKMIAAGFLDQSAEGLSSVYFVYRTEYASRGLGIFSILKEIEYTAAKSRKYYYLGYYVKGNSHMEYKSRFFPHERYDWDSGIWYRAEKVERNGG